ncbi:MAG: class I SAM-dependent methyltransferase [Ginsengibacter sp.]
MFEFHKDRKRYFDMQEINATDYVIPFIEQTFKIIPGMRVLEIGAGEGGVLKAFVNRGCIGVGVELDKGRVENGELFLREDIAQGKITFFANDIYNETPENLGGRFDIIVLKDVIEHIHDQEKLIAWLHEFLNVNGVIFFGFPPWQMPFGGHQQMCTRALSKAPWFHLLPAPLYSGLMKLSGEPQPVIDCLLEIKETGISIERFEKIIKQNQYSVVEKKHYLINPIYIFKFGWKPRTQAKFISQIPWLRDFVTTCVYYLVASEKKKVVVNSIN